MPDQRKPRRPDSPRPPLTSFGQQVERHLSAQGLSKSALAETMTTSRAHLRRILTGDVHPTPYTVRRLATVIGMDPDEALALNGYDPDSLRQAQERLALLLTEAEQHTARRLRVWFDEERARLGSGQWSEVAPVFLRAAVAHPLMPRVVEALISASQRQHTGQRDRTRMAQRTKGIATGLAADLGNEQARAVELVIATAWRYIRAGQPVLGVMPWDDVASEGAGFRRAG